VTKVRLFFSFQPLTFHLACHPLTLRRFELSPPSLPRRVSRFVTPPTIIRRSRGSLDSRRYVGPFCVFPALFLPFADWSNAAAQTTDSCSWCGPGWIHNSFLSHLLSEATPRASHYLPNPISTFAASRQRFFLILAFLSLSQLSVNFSRNGIADQVIIIPAHCESSAAGSSRALRFLATVIKLASYLRCCLPGYDSRLRRLGLCSRTSVLASMHQWPRTDQRAGRSIMQERRRRRDVYFGSYDRRQRPTNPLQCSSCDKNNRQLRRIFVIFNNINWIQHHGPVFDNRFQ
jgi:hypothetical protein